MSPYKLNYNRTTKYFRSTIPHGKNTAQSMWINNAMYDKFSIGMLGSAKKPPETLRHSVYLMCTDITLAVL